MESSSSLSAIDMNDPANLALYSQMLYFKVDTTQVALFFHQKSNTEQRILQNIAHAQGLEYEYSVFTRTVTIRRPLLQSAVASSFHDIVSSEHSRMDNINFDAYLNDDEPIGLVTPASHTSWHDPNSSQSMSPSTFGDFTNFWDQTPAQDTLFIPPSAPQLSSTQPVVDNAPYRSSIERSIRAGSTSSMQSDSLDTRMHRRIQSPASSGYREFVFDSNSVHSDSQASATSGASGRRGRLSDWARAGMDAVKKAGGACWRCKFLRNTCDVHNPCTNCPKNVASNWQILGCNRGDFKSKQPAFRWCPYTTNMPSPSLRNKDWPAGTPSSEEEISTRESWIRSVRSGMEVPSPQENEIIAAFDHHKSTNHDPATGNQPPSSLEPLIECILAISWELRRTRFSTTRSAFAIKDLDLTRLLPTAAIYQTKIDTENQLVAQSLICLRTCLEVLRLRHAGLSDMAFHQKCSSTSCSVGLDATINMHIELYLEELSKVIFKKINLRNRDGWWLSVFYSLCIQSVVRKVLQELTMEEALSQKEASAQYLRLPLRLFIACSGFRDRLDSMPASRLGIGQQGLPELDDYQQARSAVDRSEWVARGVRGSGHYLKLLFEDHDYPAPESNRHEGPTTQSDEWARSPPPLRHSQYVHASSSRVNHIPIIHEKPRKVTYKHLKKGHWTEIDDPEQRRRIQNRVAQRKFREKAKEAREREQKGEASRGLDYSFDADAAMNQFRGEQHDPSSPGFP